MKSRRNVVAVLALFALLNAGPAAADWEKPEGSALPTGVSFDDMVLGAHWGLQIAQAAF